MATSLAHSQLQVEQSLLSAALREENKLSVLQTSVTASDFVTSKREFEFAVEYLQKYKAVPTDTTMRSVFPSWQPLDGAFEYWRDHFTRMTISRKAQTSILAAMEKINESPAAAIADLVRDLSAVRVTGDAHIGASDAGIVQRLERYRLRAERYKEEGEAYVAGLRTTYEAINHTGIGWIPGELIGIFARPSVGKTWMLADDLTYHWVNGYRVLFVSPEMPKDQIGLRFDVLKAAKLGIQISHRQIFSGNPAAEPAYAQLAEQVGQHERWWTVDGIDGGAAISVAHIRQFVEQFQPDIVGIDGASLLSSTKGAEWERIKETMYALKAQATYYNLPYIVTHQSAKMSKKTASAANTALGRGDDWSMPTLNDSAFGDAFIQACSTVITYCSDQYRPEIRWYSIRKSRDRDITGQVPRYAKHVDFDHGRITDLSDYGDNDDALMQQITRLNS